MDQESMIAEYLAHGWHLITIPPKRKGPHSPGWNKRATALLTSVSPPYGVGLGHAYSGTMAFDIDDIRTTTAYGFPVQEWLDAPDAVQIVSGRPNRAKLLYKMPFGLTLPTKKVILEGVTGFEIRCGTVEGLTVQDVLPPSIHKDTKLPYEWGGKGNWRNLPMIPNQLLHVWNELLATEPFVVRVDGVDSDWDEITDAVNKIDPDCSREDWIHVGMALHWTGSQLFKPEEGFHVWNEWSKLGFKYTTERDITNQWKSFKVEKKNPVTLGTLFQIAKQSGWVRSLPDASTLFNSAETKSPAVMSQDLRPAPPDVDLSLWPEILRIRAEEVSQSVGCDPLVPLFAGLAAVCAAVDAQSRLELAPGFLVPPVLWLMTVGDPADKKSPGSHPMLAPLANIEAEDRPRFAKASDDWELKEARYAVEKKRVLEFVASPEALLDPTQTPRMPVAPPPPVFAMLTVSDITSQKLVRHCADRPRGVLCHLDEMNSWVDKLSDKSSGEDRSAWVQAFESKHYKMDRVGAGSIHAENFAVSIYGNIQPRVYSEGIKGMSKDGLLQRFIPAVLRHEKTKRGEPIPDFLTHAVKWENTLRLVYSLPAMTYKLTPEAYAVFREFQLWYEKVKQAERLVKSSENFMTALGKAEGLTGRIALLFHLMENPFNRFIDVEMIERVIKLVKGYVIPAMRYTLGEIGDVSVFERWLTDYVLQYADKGKITMGEIRTNAGTMLKHVNLPQSYQLILAGMETLEQANWVSRTDDGRRDYAGRADWTINPQIIEMFKDHRRKIIDAKQWVLTQWFEHKHPAGFKVLAHGNDG